jgi:hypothetical protein
MKGVAAVIIALHTFLFFRKIISRVFNLRTMLSVEKMEAAENQADFSLHLAMSLKESNNNSCSKPVGERGLQCKNLVSVPIFLV